VTRCSDLRVGMLNTCGLNDTAQEVEDWIIDDRINITALSETRITPGKHPGLSLYYEMMTGPLNASGRATKGGVAIVLYGMDKYKVVLRFREDFA